MRLNRRLLLVFVALLAGVLIVSWIGCTDTGTTVTEEDSDDDDDAVGDDDDNDTGGPDDEPPPEPSVDDSRSPTGLDYQTLTGTAEPGSYIRVTGAAKEASTYADAGTGSFCVSVDLILNATNILAVTATDADNNQSDPANVQIEQIRNNVNLNAQAEAASISYSEPHATPQKAIDGNKNTYWANTTQVWYPESNRSPQWFRVKYDQFQTINRIDIYWSDGAYGTDFEVYSTQADQPVQPHADEDWAQEYTLVAAQTNPTVGFNGHNQYDLTDEPIQARWLLFALYKSTQKNVLLYKFEMEEVEAYSLQSDETDPGCQ